MNKLLQKTLLGLFLLAVAILEFSSVHAATSMSIGVSPSQITNSLLSRGAEYETVLVISRAVATEEMKAKVESFGDESKSWISFPDGDTVTLAKGENRSNMKVLIKVPVEAKLGKYTSSLRFTLSNTTPGQINIIPGVRVDAVLEVTDAKIENIKILVIKMLDSVVNNPYQVSVQVNNTGNVPTHPDTMELQIQDITGKSLRQLSYTFSQDVPPFQAKELLAEIPDANPLPLGEYWAVINVKKSDKILATEKVSFRVVEAVLPTATPTPTKTDSTSSLMWMLIVLTAVFVIGAIVIIFVAFRKRNADKAVPAS